MGFFSGLVGGAKNLLFGSKGEVKTEQVPKWTTEQQELFKQLYGTVSPEIGQGLAPTPEDMAYGESLAGYEDKYRALMGEAYDPSVVDRTYGDQPEAIESIYDPSRVNAMYDPEAVKAYYRDVVMPEFEQTALPKVESQFAGPGYWGSARARAVGEAYAGIGRQEGAALYELENQRRASLLGLDTSRRSALLMSDENRRAQVLDLEKQGHSALANLATQLPIMNQTLAAWARSFSPEQSPYMQMALSMLGLQPFDTVAGFDPAQNGVVQSFLQGFGNQAGKTLGGSFL